MKQIFLLASLFLTVTVANAQNQVWGLQTDKGIEVPLGNVDFLLAADNDTQFSIVLKEGTAIDSVQVAYVKMITEAGIAGQNISDTTPSLLMVGEKLIVSGGDKAADVAVYGIDGARQGVSVLHGNTTTVDVSRLPQGTYVLKVGTRAVKFMKK